MDAHLSAPPAILSPQALAQHPGYRLMGLRPNPLRTWHKVALGLLAVGVVGAGVFFVSTTARAQAPAPPSDAEAVAAAVQQLGNDAPTSEISQLAFAAAYPGRSVEDPQWSNIVKQVETALGRPLVPIKIPSSSDPSSDDAAELVSDWMSSLLPGQVSSARDAVGVALWDPLVFAATNGDDVSTRGALLAIKLAIQTQAHGSKLAALSTYASLQSSLGDDKLEEFIEILDDTVGRPQVNPAARPPWRSSA